MKLNFTSYATVIATGLIFSSAADQAVAQTQSHSVVAAILSSTPRTLIVDQQAIFQTSKVGEDVERQLQAFKQSEQAEFAASAKELREEQEALQLQLPTLAPDVREKKIAAFRAKQMDLRQKVQIRQDMLQGGDMNAREQVEQAPAPIVQDIMRERGANLVLQKSSLVQSAGDVDITATVIQRLDRKLSGLKVKFVATPGTMTMMQ